MSNKKKWEHQYQVDGFWNDTHPLSPNYKELITALVPDADNCATVEGEYLRAANRIAYDLFNNGWGCNNWSGAVVFLKKNIHALPHMKMEWLDAVHAYSHGEPAFMGSNDEKYEKYQFIVTSIVAAVVQSIIDVLANGSLTMNEQDLDIFQFQEPSWEPEEDDEGYDF